MCCLCRKLDLVSGMEEQKEMNILHTRSSNLGNKMKGAELWNGIGKRLTEIQSHTWSIAKSPRKDKNKNKRGEASLGFTD